jgi:hypothetical protein
MSVDAAEIARGYKALLEVERGWRDLKQLELRPVYHRKDDRIIAHVQLSWLALLLIRTAEIACGDTWRNLSAELDRIQLHTYDTGPAPSPNAPGSPPNNLPFLSVSDCPNRPATTSGAPSPAARRRLGHQIQRPRRLPSKWPPSTR